MTDAERQREHIRLKLERGECRSCKNPLLPNRHFCQYHYDNRRERARLRRIANPEATMLYDLKYRARMHGIECTISVEDIVIPGICPVFGTAFVIGGPVETRHLAPSIDRIDSTLGYIKGNVQVISFKANAMKQNASIADMILLGKWAESQTIGSPLP